MKRMMKSLKSVLFCLELTFREIDKEEVFRVLHTTESTYTTLTDLEKEGFDEWIQKRDIAFLHSIKLNLIKSHPIIQVMYKRLVPATVTETNFWNYYFSHMEKAGYDFSRLQTVEAIPPVAETSSAEIMNEPEASIISSMV